ncbi:MAG: hypothetical protein AAGD13_05090 [Pseudomonadota bacterium]
MSNYFVKNPASSLDYTFDWGFQFLDAGEAISTDIGWSIAPDEAATGGLAVDSTSSSASSTTVILSGGEPGKAYLVASRIQTTASREIERSLIVRVANL